MQEVDEAVRQPRRSRRRVAGAAALLIVGAVGVVWLTRDANPNAGPDGAGVATTDAVPSEPTSTVQPQAPPPFHFDHQIVDENPPSGSGCCLDVLAVGDVDGDGDGDLVVGAENADGLSWYANPSDGSIESTWSRRPIGTGDFSTDLEAADLDADGDLDLVASSIDRDVIEWWEQSGDPTEPDGWIRHEIGPDFAHDLVVADIDGNGALDVAAFHNVGQRIDWFEQINEPAGTWVQHVVDNVAGEGLAVADLDADGDYDLVGGPAAYTNTTGDGSSWLRQTLTNDWPVRGASRGRRHR